MSSQRYERVSEIDQDDNSSTSPTLKNPHFVPTSPPPSFRSRASSPTSRRLLSEDPITSDADRNLADTFDDGSDSDNDSHDEGDDWQRLMRNNTSQANIGTTTAHDESRPTTLQRTPTTMPVLTPIVPASRSGAPTTSSNDGVFANLDAKPDPGEKSEELPPSYEAAAADATPPYWETTILAPGQLATDEVYVDGLPVGSLFSFVWNAMISMSFQLVGFLLTYLLHTTHAAKNGSRAGLGITLVQYGFYMRGGGKGNKAPDNGDDGFIQPQQDPNAHDFDPGAVGGAVAAAAMASSQGTAESASSGVSNVASSEWFAYVLMIVGWFILIRAVSDFLKARRHEQLVLRSPERGLNVPVVGEGEAAETVV